MNFRTLRSVAFIFSLGAMVGLYSCNSDDDLEQDVQFSLDTNNEQSLIAQTINLSAKEFDELVEEVKKDTTVKSYSVFDPSTMNSLKSLTDSYDPNGHSEKIVLYGLQGLRLSGHLRAKMQGLITDKNSTWYGWYIFDVDLNDGAGGDYLYLAARFISDSWSNGGAITSLSAYNYIPRDKSIVRTSDLDYFNCNFGTKKGGPIYLATNREEAHGASPITGMMIVSRSRRPDSKKGDYKMDPAIDLNAGAGGDYVYIYTKH